MAADPRTESNNTSNGEHAFDDEKLQFDGHDEFSKTEKGEPQEPEDPENPTKWTFTRIIALIALCGVYVGSQMILYFVSPALNFIAITLKTDIPNWLLTANTLAVAAICPFVGYLTDLLGRRWVCMFGALCLIIGSIVLATSKNLGAGCAAMAVAGIGAGICELTALAGVAEITPHRWRGVTLSVVTFSIVPFMPTVLYVILIEQDSTWRWCFCLTALWNFASLVGIFFCYRPPPRHNVDGLTSGEILKRIDYMGAFLSIGGVTMFLVGLQAGGYQYPWTSGKVLGPLIPGTIMVILFPIWEWWGPHKYPMMPREIFQGQRVVALAYSIVFIAGMDFYSLLGFFPLTLEDVYSTSLITIGIRALSYPWAILGGACIGSFLMSYTRGHVRELFFVMAAIMTAFLGAMAKSNPHNPAFTVTMATFASFGNGGLVVPALTLALYACPDQYIGTTTALSLSSRFLGGSIGTAIYFNIFNTKIRQKIPALVGPAAVKSGLNKKQTTEMVKAMASPNALVLAPKVPGATKKVLTACFLARQCAYADSLKYVWYTTIPFGIIGVLCTLALPNIRKYMTNKVAVDIH